jgi:acyl carrier protein
LKETAMPASLSDVISVVQEVLRDNEIKLQRATRFEDIQGWDPMDLVSVVVEIECRLGVQFELMDIDRIVTIGDMLSMVSAKQAMASACA